MDTCSCGDVCPCACRTSVQSWCVCVRCVYVCTGVICVYARVYVCAGAGGHLCLCTCMYVCVRCRAGDGHPVHRPGVRAPRCREQAPAPLTSPSFAWGPIYKPHSSLSFGFLHCKMRSSSSPRAMWRRGDRGFVNWAPEEVGGRGKAPGRGLGELDPGSLRREAGAPAASAEPRPPPCLVPSSSSDGGGGELPRPGPVAIVTKTKRLLDPPGRSPGPSTRESTCTKAKPAW